MKLILLSIMGQNHRIFLCCVLLDMFVVQLQNQRHAEDAGRMNILVVYLPILWYGVC